MPNPLQSLFEGVEGVDQTIIEHLTPIFEARVDERVKEKLTELNEEHETQIANLQESLDEAVSFNITESNKQFAKKLDTFLEQAVVTWANENSVPIQENAVVAAAGNFFSHLSEAAMTYNSILPEKDTDEEIEVLKQKNESYKARLNDSIARVSELNESLVQVKRDQIVESVSVGMSSFGKQTLAEKCSDADFINESQFTRLANGYKFIIEKDDEDDDGQIEIDEKAKLKEGENLPQDAAQLDKQTKKDKKPVLENARQGIDMSLFIR